MGLDDAGSGLRGRWPDRRPCNQLAITGSGWDPELLRLELGELNLAGFDLSLTGFGDLELKDLLAERTGGADGPRRRAGAARLSATVCPIGFSWSGYPQARVRRRNIYP
jgi:hypothetical protein